MSSPTCAWLKRLQKSCDTTAAIVRRQMKEDGHLGMLTECQGADLHCCDRCGYSRSPVVPTGIVRLRVEPDQKVQRHFNESKETCPHCQQVRTTQFVFSSLPRLLFVETSRFAADGKKGGHATLAPSVLLATQSSELADVREVGVESDAEPVLLDVAKETQRYRLVGVTSAKSGMVIGKAVWETIVARKHDGEMRWISITDTECKLATASPCVRSSKKTELFLYAIAGEVEGYDVDAELRTEAEPEAPSQPSSPLATSTPTLTPMPYAYTVDWYDGTESAEVACFDSRGRMPAFCTSMQLAIDTSSLVNKPKFRLAQGWIQKCVYSDHHYALQILSCITASTPPTTPTRTTARALLQKIVEADIPMPLISVKEEIRVVCEALGKPRRSDEKFLKDEVLSARVVEAAVRMIQRTSGVTVSFTLYSSTNSASVPLLLPGVLARHPLRLLFDTMDSRCVVLLAKKTKEQASGSRINAIARLQRTQVDLAFGEKKEEEVKVSLQDLSFLVKVHGKWRCNICAAALPALVAEYSDTHNGLVYARGEGQDESTDARLAKRLNRHATSTLHNRAVEHQKDTQTTQTTTATPTLQPLQRRPTPQPIARHRIRATDAQKRSLFNLTLNVATATTRGEGLRGVLDRIRDDEIKGLDVLVSHRSWGIAKEIQSIIYDTTIAKVIAEVRACNCVTLKTDATTYGDIDLALVSVRGLRRSTRTLHDWLIGGVDIVRNTAEVNKDALVDLLGSLGLLAWAKRSVRGFAADRASVMVLCRKQLEVSLGIILIDISDGAHLHALAVGSVRNTRDYTALRRCMNQWFSFFKSASRKKALKLVQNTVVAFPRDHKVRWANATFRRITAALTNLEPSIAVVEAQVPPPPFFHTIREDDFALRLSIAGDIFDVCSASSEALQNQSLSLTGLERVMTHSKNVLFMLQKSPGKREVEILRRNINDSVVAEAQLWRTRMCKTIRKNLTRRWDNYPCRAFCSFFSTAADVTSENLMGLASALGLEAHVVYAIGMEWSVFRMNVPELSGGALKLHLIKYVLEHDADADRLHNLLECMLALSPSSVFLECAFSIVNRHRTKHRKALTSETMVQELVVSLHLPDDVEHRGDVAHEVVEAFLSRKPRRFTVKTPTALSKDIRKSMLRATQNMIKCKKIVKKWHFDGFGHVG